MVSITLPDIMERQLQAVIAETGGTIAEWVENAVERYLREWAEDQEESKAAGHALEEYERDGNGIPWEQVKQELGLR